MQALVAASGLSLVEPIDFDVYERYDYQPIDLNRIRHLRPHMVVQIDETVFTSVMMFLTRPTR